MVLIRTVNSETVGVYSEHPLKKELNQEKKRSLLFNLEKEKFYPLRVGERNRPFMYDEFYMVMGNSELRVEFNKK